MLAIKREMNYNTVMKKFFRAAACVAAVAPLALVCACAEGEQTNFVDTIYSMGTWATIVIPQTESAFSSCSDGEKKFLSFRDGVYQILNSADNSLSATLVSSCIYAYNNAQAGARVEIDKTAYDVLLKAKEVYAFTEGYYNPAVYYSVKAYGFPLTSEKAPELPSEQSVSAFKELASHFNELQLSENDGKYYAVKPSHTVTVDGVEYSLAVDLGGIGKGWCADKVSDLMAEKGYNYGLFNFSLSSMSVKSYAFNKDGYYTLEPHDPRGSGSFCSIKVKDVNLSTSGDHMQYYLKEGVRYCHIIDPFTGSPIQTGVASVTVTGGSAVEDDALTTALSCMGKQKAVEFINEKLTDRTVIMLIIEDGEGKIITNRPQEITIYNSQYRIANTVQDGRIVL